MGIRARNLTAKHALRRRDFILTFTDDIDRNTKTFPSVCFGYPQPDATKTREVFIIDDVYLTATAVHSAGSLTISAVSAGSGGTTCLTTAPSIAGGSAVPANTKVAEAGKVVPAVLKTDATVRVPAGTAIYGSIALDNDGTGANGAITAVVSGYFDDEI